MRVQAIIIAVGLAADARAQFFSQRGFVETRNYIYPQTAPGDSGQLVSEELLQWDSSLKLKPWAQVNASFAARFDSHRQFERAWRLDWSDRGLQRPAVSARRLSLLLHKGGLTFEGGRQFIRWGKTDILNPTDRFAPKDFLNVISTDYLGVTAVRATYERGGETLDAVYQPVFTPSRAPLLNQRWVVLPPEIRQFPVADQGSLFPGRGAYGLRWNHVGMGYEFAACFYDGSNYLPLYNTGLRTVPQPTITLQRYFAQMRMYGGDVAVPLRWFTVKGEAGYFTSSTPTADEYALYVIQLERQIGEWTFVGGYAGDAITRRRTQLGFTPDLGLSESLIGRVSYNLDANRSVAFQTVVRQNGAGMYAQFEYTQAIGAHFRLTGSATLLRGNDSDFLGQYHHNSNFQLILRYSF